MTTPEARLKDLGLVLPDPPKLPPGLVLPFTFINVRGDRAFISGHTKQEADGSLSGQFGPVGAGLTTAEAQGLARDIGLTILGNLRREIGTLDRVAGWLRVFGMVNSAPGYTEQHVVMNGFSDLILEVFGPETGRHARSSMGAAGMPLNFSVEIEAEVLLHDA